MDRQISMEGKKGHNIILFVIELILAIILSAGLSLVGMSNLLTAPNTVYPNPTDALGHMTKVIYIAEELLQGHIPSWFPYWYNGSAVTQYYVPLSYYLMVPVYLITKNVMLTYKIFCAGVMIIGSMGVWTFCYRKIGRFCGLAAIIAFSLQPILLQSLYREGVIAQGPIFAIMPWFLLLVLSCAQKPTRGKFIGNTIIVTLMILSHAMNAYMVCFTTVIVMVLFILLKKIKIRNLIITSGSIVFAGILTAFWSIVGATVLENPGVPYLLPEAAAYTTARLSWFIPDRKDAFLYFSIEVTAFSALALLCYLLAKCLKKNNENRKYYGLAGILLTAVTMAFSFGYQLPGFRFLPMASGMVPGRILTYTAVTGAISCAYVVYVLWNFRKVRLVLRPVTLGLIAVMVIGMNPYDRTYPTITSDSFDTMKAVTDNKSRAFEKGRYNWYGTQDSSETLFAFENGYNISNGWNIEGTPQNRTIYNNYIALPSKQYDYIAKEIAFWNIRYLLLNNEYKDFGQQLADKLLFQNTGIDRIGFSLYTSSLPSSYYLLDPRNSLIISPGMQGFSIHFPNMVQGKSKDLKDYSLTELLKYKLIYIIEPDINTLIQKNEFESKVTKLVNAGIKVMIEPAASKNFELFGVNADNEFFKSSPRLQTTEECPYLLDNEVIKDNSSLRMIRSLYGLDKVYADFTFGNDNIKNAVLGTKKVGKGEIIFVGAHLSQYLEAVYTRNNGLGSVNSTVKENSNYIQSIYSAMLSYYGVNMNYLPENFETVKQQSWDYQGGSFTYESGEEKEVTVSVTYSPRWTAAVDGKKIDVGQCENLITLKLPAGEHKVVLSYGITIYGKIGYLISAVGLLFFLMTILLWKSILRCVEKISVSLRSYLQFGEDKDDGNNEDGKNNEKTSEETNEPEELKLLQPDPVLEEAAVAYQEIPNSNDTEDNMPENNIPDNKMPNNKMNWQTESLAMNRNMEVDQDKIPETDEETENMKVYQETVYQNGIQIEIIETGDEEKSSVLDVQKWEEKKEAGDEKEQCAYEQDSVKEQENAEVRESVKKQEAVEVQNIIEGKSQVNGIEKKISSKKASVVGKTTQKKNRGKSFSKRIISHKSNNVSKKALLKKVLSKKSTAKKLSVSHQRIHQSDTAVKKHRDRRYITLHSKNS